MLRIFSILVITLFFINSSSVFSYELVNIQTISKSKKSFVTRQGRKDGINVGLNASFTNDKISVLVEAIEVSRNYTIWKPKDSKHLISFTKGETLAFTRSAEYLSRFKPKEEIKIQQKKKQEKTAIALNLYLFQGLSETYSGVDDYKYDRGGIQYHGSFLYSTLESNLIWAFGLMYESESTASQTVFLSSQRFYLTFNINYLTTQFENFYNSSLYLGLGAGIGFSNTDILNSSQVGFAFKVPETRISLETPISRKYSLSFNLAFESMSLLETLEDKSKQETNAINLKFGIGFLNYY